MSAEGQEGVPFELSDRDLEGFQKLVVGARKNARDIDENDVLRTSRQLLDKTLNQTPPDFMRQRIERLKQLVDMAEDDAWTLPDAYFVASDDVIPDSVPVLGLLDDAIVAELALQSFKHELAAHEKFSQFREAEAKKRATAGKTTDISKEDWLADRRATLHSGMREHGAAEPVCWPTVTLWGFD